MKGIVKVNTEFSIEAPDHFWNQNPHLVYMKPFSQFYKLDKSKNQATSSRWMWYCHFMKCPYDVENPFYRIAHDSRDEMLKDTLLKEYELPDLDIEMAFEECFDNYAEIALSTVEKEFENILEELKKIKTKVNETDITYDTTKIEVNTKTGQPASITIKGNSKEYTALLKAILPLTKQFQEIYNALVIEKSKEINYGNTQINKGEDDSW